MDQEADTPRPSIPLLARYREFIVYSRESLFEKVWEVRLEALARAHGISVPTLVKLCRKHVIPLPPRGHWNKVEAGLAVMRAPLPATNAKSLRDVVLPDPRHVAALAGRAVVDREATPEIGAMLDADRVAPPVTLATDLRHVPEIIGNSRTRLVRTEARFGGPEGRRAWERDHPWFKIDVSRALRTRALLILDAVFRGVVARGGRVEFRTDEQLAGRPLALANVRPSLALYEVVERPRASPGSTAARQFMPTGRLTLEITAGTGWETSTRRWRDTKHRLLESHLDDVLHELVGVIAYRREREARSERAADAAAADRLRKAEEEAHRQAVRDWKRSLLRAARRWESALRVRAYAAAVRARVASAPHEDASGSLGRWCEQAEALAAELEPLPGFDECPTPRP